MWCVIKSLNTQTELLKHFAEIPKAGDKIKIMSLNWGEVYAVRVKFNKTCYPLIEVYRQ